MRKLLIILAFFWCQANGQVLNIFPDEPVLTYKPGTVLNIFGNYNIIPNSIKQKFILWTSNSDERLDYYINKIGDQERELYTQNNFVGIIHSGRSISYDSLYNQYSEILSGTPNNMKLYNNSISFSLWIRTDGVPAHSSFVFGNVPGVINGIFCIFILPSGLLQLSIRHTSSINIYSSVDVCDGIWHNITVIMNKSSTITLYVDNIIQNTPVDISTFTFNNHSLNFRLGGTSPGYNSKKKEIKDVRIWPFAISEVDRYTAYLGDYVEGCAGWWLCEEDNSNLLHDAIGVNNMANYNFNATSFVKNYQKSNLNKYGYSISNEGLINSPLITSFDVTKDINNDDLIFKGQAKYNLIKITEDSVSLPDSVDELIQASGYITVNDWYNNGVANHIKKSNISSYQFGRQYYNGNELIIIKDDELINVSEDNIIKKYMGITSGCYRGGICLSFDDTQNIDTWLYADTNLQNYGWKASFCIMTPAANTTYTQDSNYIVGYKTRLNLLIESGHELTNHGVRHYSLSSYLGEGHTCREYYDNMIYPLQTIFQTVLNYIPMSFAYPSWFGTNLEMSNIILDEGFVYVRENLVDIPLENSSVICYNGTNQIVYSVDLAPFTLDQATDEEILTLLDYARDYNVVVCMLCHKIVPIVVNPSAEISIDRMKMICQYILDNNMKFYTMSELITSLFE